MKPDGALRLQPLPFSLKAANKWVEAHHRHNKPVRGHKFSVGAVDDDGTVWGVAIAGRPVARASDDGLTIEVYRSVTLEGGPPNVNSFLYARCWRVARELGYLRCISMTQGEEEGTSLKAAGYRLIGERKPRGSWAESTKDAHLKGMRDPVGNGGVPRKAWLID